MPTVIDSLIVKLGLDPKDFEKGQKAAAASVLETKRTVGRANDEMGAGFSKLVGRLTSVVAVLALIKKGVGALSDISKETRQLGIDSQNFGLAANRLRNFQNAAEMLGGKAEDVTRSVEGLQKAVYDLTITGKSSESLEMLTRLGVQFQDSTGHARDFRDIVLDTADALDRAQKNGTLNRQEAYFAAKASGLDDGTAKLALMGRAGASAELAAQEARRQVSAGDIASAERNERFRENVNQTTKAEIGIPAMSKGTDAVAAGFKAVGNASDRLSQSLGDLADRIKGSVHRGRTGRASYESTIQSAAQANGLDPEILAGLLKAESGFNPAARSKAGAVGIAQLMPQYHPGAGNDPDADIRTAARVLRENLDRVKADAPYAMDDGAAMSEALQMYNAGQGRVRGSKKPGGKPLAKETVDYPGKILGYAQRAKPTPSATRGGGSSTTLVGPVTVNTQATDANGVARDMGGAVRRKMNAAQAEPGMQ